MPPIVRVERLAGNPIITEKMLPGNDGASLDGPSLIRVPAWVKNPLGNIISVLAIIRENTSAWLAPTGSKGRGPCATAAR